MTMQPIQCCGHCQARKAAGTKRQTNSVMSRWRRKLRHDRTIQKWLVLYAVTFLFILPFFCGLCSQSLYFAIRRHLLPDTYRNYIENDDHARMRLAKDFFETVNPTEVKETLETLATRGPSLDIAIVVVTAARDPEKTQSNSPEYVTETVGKLLSHMTDPSIMSTFPYSIRLIVCNAGTDPSQNAAALRLSKFLRVISLARKSPPKTTRAWFENESTDYMMCLRQALLYAPRYVLALEDDAYAKDDVWSLLKFVISQKLDRRVSHGTTTTDTSQVAYVKLMRPEYQLCYFKRGLDDKLELLGACVLFGTVATMVQTRFQIVFCPGSLRRRDYATWLAWCLYFMLVILATGRPCLLELRRFLAPYFYSYVPAQNCCIPAVLFPEHGARTLVEYLNNTRINRIDGKDITMDYMLRDKDLKAYQVFPSAFTHIGHISTKLNRDAFHVY